ncbi:hypothetical protein [Amycolatopsis sp. cmx-4-68]|uniref:hypothetical protein n=1 Tax=Amycolatopsis sp. cmx-4-68 TaxID=2790938 RepID=UPI00397B32E9
MAVSPEAQQFAQFLESASAKTATAGLDLAIIRDIVETSHRASTEPEDVSYAEVDADGVPGIWCIPEGADPDRALLHFHFGGSVTASMQLGPQGRRPHREGSRRPLARRGLPPGARALLVRCQPERALAA